LNDRHWLRSRQHHRPRLVEPRGRSAGCEVIRPEKRSGTSTQGCEELCTVLDVMRKGDVLMVTWIDRLARSIGDHQDIVRAIKA
jgi:DNA invertase Pin-like site-specific DNA recombinase